VSVTFALRCRICEYVEAPGPATDCPRCDGPTDIAYDLAAVAAVVSRTRVAAGPPSLWRYGDLLPADVGVAATTAGWTPLVRVESLSAALDIDLRVKLETANPSASYKDRTAALAGAAAVALGLETICCTSTGALGRAVAADAAARGLEAIVLAPEGTGGAAREAGAQVIEIDGSWDECREIEGRLTALFPWGFVASNLHPYAVEGPKTTSFEIAEQLGWEAPDAIVCPVASGALLAKIAQGFHELRAVGLVDDERRPRLVGAQAGGYSPLAAAFAAGGAVAARDRAFEDLALGAARTSGGAVLSLPPEDVDGYAAMLAAAIGVDVDGAGGAALGALVEAVRSRRIRAGDRVVLVASGVRDGERAPGVARAVPPELRRVLAALGVE
jgi:threonine synthase